MRPRNPYTIFACKLGYPLFSILENKQNSWLFTEIITKFPFAYKLPSTLTEVCYKAVGAQPTELTGVSSIPLS